jgi:hypothetical protein
MPDNHYHLNIQTELIIMAICAVISIIIIWHDCSNHTAVGYVQQVCDKGFGIFDILCLIFLSPLYLIFILVNNFIFSGGYAGVKLW